MPSNLQRSCTPLTLCSLLLVPPLAGCTTDTGESEVTPQGAPLLVSLWNSKSLPKQRTISLPVNKPGNVGERATLRLSGFDFDQREEGALYINERGPIKLFGNHAKRAHDSRWVDVEFDTSSSWWHSGSNELRFVHTKTAGYKISAIRVTFSEGDGGDGGNGGDGGDGGNGGGDPIASTCIPGTRGGTFDAVRINGGQPLVTRTMFTSRWTSQGRTPTNEGHNINGPSVIRIPNFVPRSRRAAPNANYYMYFGHHKGRYLRMAWAERMAGPWTLYNVGPNINRPGVLDLGPATERQIGPRWKMWDHCASPDAFVDHDNKRIVVYFHCKAMWHRPGRDRFAGEGQLTFVATSDTGLNFNSGIQPIALTGAYSRAFVVDNHMFGFLNKGYMFKVPTAGVGPTDDRAWKPHENENKKLPWENVASPMHKLYRERPHNREPDDARHFAVLTACDDPDSVFVFWTSKGDAPERIYLTRFDLTGLNATDRITPEKWRPVGVRLILQPEEQWEGTDRPCEPSAGSDATNANQLRDPAVFVDADGTAYLCYSGRGESAIGCARLEFSQRSNASGPQVNLGEAARTRTCTD